MTQKVIEITILSTKGSTPRNSGTTMQITPTGQSGTIGGGQLELQATQKARKMLSDGQTSFEEVITLGANCGQCCGGQVRLNYQENTESKAVPKSPIWIFGAGHVGRAIAATLSSIGRFDVTVVDPRQDWLLGVDGAPMLAQDPVATIPLVPQDAQVFILTHSHDLDLSLCHAALKRDIAGIHLIGSATKWERFKRRLRAMGSEPSRIICPIGDTRLGKEPTEIALGVAHKLLIDQAATITESQPTKAIA
ncbi:MAG: xanthine dehydrogenase accessory protein XdhC [Paracoccaceae bacterium]|nr:xanthine dehydrogenase accessory protein XdhC [Paracoccaceae bacterium]